MTAGKRIQQLPLCNYEVVSSDGLSGGLWLLWGSECTVSVVFKNSNVVIADVGYQDEEWRMVGVYGDPTRIQSSSIWELIDAFIGDVNKPTCLVGDFNAIVAEEEKQGGNAVLGTPNRRFKEWIHGAELLDLGYHGPCYTWSNKRADEANVSERLDRGLGNLSWSLKFPKTAVFHLPRFNSDHMPILICTDPSPIARPRRFKTENWWLAKDGFREVCQRAADRGGTDWGAVRDSLKREVARWDGVRTSPKVMLGKIEQEMLELNSQQQSQRVVQRDRALQRQHAEYLTMLDTFWHQRSRVNWAQLGDRNTHFFHSMAVVRHRRNQIRAIQGEDGQWEVSEKGIRQLFLAHFRQIYGGSDCVPIHQALPVQVISTLPKIPSLVSHGLEQPPGEHEVLRALASLGPDKAPGPDGVNARLIQQYWEVFRPSVMRQVNSFFQQKCLPSTVARSNMVLVPKCENPVRVTDFRPISVCNVVYKIISKTLAARIRPFIAGLISENQCAFVPGREISENVILLREILHSFNSANYRNRDFCLKLDLSKAFDRMNWSYLQSLLPLYGFPPILCDWIMICVRSAEFSIVVNGRGDGFLKPKSGLRQGCALSPYLFILGMDVLSRSLQLLTENGNLHGIKLAPSAPAITNSLYADDLLLFGRANLEEASTIMGVMEVFSAVSGQKVGADKSQVWFSRCTPVGVREEIAEVLGVTQNHPTGKYLGAPISTATGAFNFLIDKFMAKLQLWKSRKLSPSGRLVLIKSVLQSVPLYYFGTTILPQGVISKLTSIIRSFFWGKEVGKRYLAYVSWGSITAPVALGGLGVRDLSRVNHALLLKVLWKLAEGEGSLWAQVLKAKYIPRSQLWQSKRTYRCTIFWRSLMALRDKLRPMISWSIGNGEGCPVYGQPWFPGALDFVGPGPQDRRLVIADLTLPGRGLWDVNELSQRFGVQNSAHIVSCILPPTSHNGNDRLLFNLSSTGSFSVKKAYNHLCVANGQLPGYNPHVWKQIWKFGRIQPRLRLFMWKLARAALPLAKTVFSRTGYGTPTCALCSQADEDGVHMAFKCAFARSCWLVSDLPLLTDQLPNTIGEVLTQVLTWMTEEQWSSFAIILWAIWRCRNGRMYQGKQQSTQQFLHYARQIRYETSLVPTAPGPPPSLLGGIPPLRRNVVCCTDASWLSTWDTGMGFVVMEGDLLLAYGAQFTSSSCPLQAEAKALLGGMRYVSQRGLQECTFGTDNLILAQGVSQLQPPTDVDWRAASEMFEIWEFLQNHEGWNCIHVSRCHNELADRLAGWGRRERLDVVGFTFPIFRNA